MKKLRIALIILVIVGIATWLILPVYMAGRLNKAEPVALAALESDTKVSVSSDEWLVMKPAGKARRTGLVFYPGADCDERGYAVPLRQIAAAGFTVVIVDMPLHMAALNPNAATDVAAAMPEIERWVIAGHSLGGAMASYYAYNNQEKISGLLLWDSYPPAANSMVESSMPITQLHRTDENGIAPDMYIENAGYLPASARIVNIPGGSHMNYGNFILTGRWLAEPPATTPVETQQQIIVDASLELLERVDAQP